MKEKKWTVMAVDDEQDALDGLVRKVEKRDDLRLVLATTEGELARSLATQLTVDIALIDLDLRTMHGYEIMDILGVETQVIVCTGSDTLGSEALDHGAVDFLNKPTDGARFNRSINRAIEQHRLRNSLPAASPSGTVQLPNADRSAFYSIRWNDIVYVRANGKQSVVFRSDGRVLQCAYMLRQIEMLMPPTFVRIARFFLLNLDEMDHYHVRSADRKVVLKSKYVGFGGQGDDITTTWEKNGELPIGNAYLGGLAAKLGIQL